LGCCGRWGGGATVASAGHYNQVGSTSYSGSSGSLSDGSAGGQSNSPGGSGSGTATGSAVIGVSYTLTGQASANGGHGWGELAAYSIQSKVFEWVPDESEPPGDWHVERHYVGDSNASASVGGDVVECEPWANSSSWAHSTPQHSHTACTSSCQADKDAPTPASDPKSWDKKIYTNYSDEEDITNSMTISGKVSVEAFAQFRWTFVFNPETGMFEQVVTAQCTATTSSNRYEKIENVGAPTAGHVS
jgi:hypothetical protein